ncbi:hypothetical protein AVEN_242743-1 [Araneus ventricosus]|uniref:Uncharacterized protein n=1 Tax=Araneus ventricosus TaxID=182803 RepID=A0A4Y2LES3_ARAVE|nr:hypothetical protein AVEN_242743-1 [Araneus ventricosus]
MGFRDDIAPCPSSPGVTPCSFLLWGSLKFRVYLVGDPISTALQDNISRAVLSIPGGCYIRPSKMLCIRNNVCVHDKGDHIERGLCPRRGSAFIESAMVH